MKLFYRRFGTGQRFLILHGLFGISDNWVTLGKRFAERYEVIIPDLRNHGRSPQSPVFDLPSMEEDVLELIEEGNEGPVLLMGHSLGGRVAVNLALNHPRRIGKLVIVDISLRNYPPQAEHLALIEAMRSVDLSAAKSRTQASEQLGTHIPSLKLRQFLLKNLYWRDRGELGWRLNLPVISRNLPAIFEYGTVPGSYPGPALFVRGERSGYILESDLPAIHKTFPGVTVTTISGASHWVHDDNPGAFYQVVKSFLDR